MNIGLTYDLRQDYLAAGFTMEQTAELDKPETIDGIENALTGLGFEVTRIGSARNLARLLDKGKRWDMVFNICEGMFGSGRESLVPCLLDYYQIPYVFSDPAVLALCLDKGRSKQIVRDMNLPTGWFQVIGSVSDLKQIEPVFPAFVKPAAEGTGKGIDQKSVVHDPWELLSVCTDLFTRFNQPLLIEEFLPGTEVTVGIVGSKDWAEPVATMELVFRDENIYSCSVKENYLEKVQYRLVLGDLKNQAEDLALKIWQGLGCMDGGRVDLRQDQNGCMTFIEVNPLAGLNPVHSDLPILSRLAGWSYDDLIKTIMDSALRRSGLKLPEKTGSWQKPDNRSLNPLPETESSPRSLVQQKCS
ncbi:D-alanine--D-alanine ligase family protein [Desulfonatronovibrio hydrogenovorans]|uniref:D-alanine--D-alanine ligase family protein n=1 Tax=Desulfonatronovibrio hydrogenovorans TaxID=53245 RepID=UPI0006906442|nr:hypothetical protein [Desulfonatronovibrio hydrogenovorans]